MRLRDLGSDRLTWADLKAIVTHSPRSSALYRAQNGESAQWGLVEHLLAIIADALRWLVWAKTKDGSKNRNRPKPIPRPGARPEQGRMKDAKAMPPDKLKAFLKRPRKPIVGKS